MIKIEDVQDKVLHLRNENVIIDSDVAALYDVETREINQAVKNNPEKFPEGYIFQLTKDEREEVIKNFDNLKKTEQYITIIVRKIKNPLSDEKNANYES